MRKHKVLTTMAAAAMLALLPSCDMVYEDLPECHYGARLRFVYDHNMEFADAFSKQVDCLMVLVYDAEGRYVTTLTEQGDALADENYRMDIDLPAGHYTMVAYGGMSCDRSSFRFREEPAETGLHSSNLVELHPDNYFASSRASSFPGQGGSHRNAPVSEGEGAELHNHFYGAASVEVKDDYTAYDEQTVKLMRNTNTLRVLLQQADGEPLDCDEFDFRVIADNTLMDHTNRVVPTGDTTYWPWTTGNEQPGQLEGGRPATVAWGEFSIPRIVDRTQVAGLSSTAPYAGPRLNVTYKADGREVIDIPLIDYLLLTKPAGGLFAGMENQEYLDRENTWSLFFFLDRHYQWVQVQISVRSWTVRFNNPNL